MEHLVTREGDLFQISDRYGEFSAEHQASGLFLLDTRHLNRFELTVSGERPEPLTVDGSANLVQRTVSRARGAVTSMSNKATLTVERERILQGGVMYERVRLTNFGSEPAKLSLAIDFGSDFCDLFELRGATRKTRGRKQTPRTEESKVVLGYTGLDGVRRETALAFTPAPAELTGERAVWEITLAPRESAAFDIAATPATGSAFPDVLTFDKAKSAIGEAYEAWRQDATAIRSDSDHLNRVLERSLLDLKMLVADRGQGPFLVAGIPWFAVPFGRDSLIAALQTLSIRPELARGTLRTMASLQGQSVDAWRLEEPGKIPHELRFGEMANQDEIPFRRYYGSVDATPLFLVLVGEYYAWTGDLDLVRELKPAIDAALTWIDTYGDPDRDGFVEYRADAKGLGVQSWKDSNDSMSHRDGAPAESPVAVSEVQGYVYAAKKALAPIFARLGDEAAAQRLEQEAESLKERFNAAFWMADQDCPAIALDGQKRQVGTVSSDAGHCLFAGILDEEKGARLARRLTAPDIFSGWGIRTLSANEKTYNPMSYHNGSVWPHDNSLVVLGLKRYGFGAEANQVSTAILDAALGFPGGRLPELYCGFSRAEGLPVEYPVSCSPQAWAAGTPFALVQAMLGLRPDAAAGVLHLSPTLPESISHVALRGLRVGGAIVDLDVTRTGMEAVVREGSLSLRDESGEVTP